MDKCNRCGKCCYYKVYILGQSYFSDKHCPFFDPETNLCKNYEDRFSNGVGCLTVEEAIEKSALPNDCPYVEDIEDYEGPIII
jgi:uncharacterized cysteine cluster protein YcgN (CxxCxxCC family)